MAKTKAGAGGLTARMRALSLSAATDAQLRRTFGEHAQARWAKWARLVLWGWWLVPLRIVVAMGVASVNAVVLHVVTLGHWHSPQTLPPWRLALAHASVRLCVRTHLFVLGAMWLQLEGDVPASMVNCPAPLLVANHQSVVRPRRGRGAGSRAGYLRVGGAKT